VSDETKVPDSSGPEPVNVDPITRLRSLCGGPRDGALLRFALGNALLANAEAAAAAVELQRSVEFDPGYSAAWKLLGRALVQAGDPAQARRAWNEGIAAAVRAGDVQAQKEMQVFLKRLDKPGGHATRE
jgi:predicted Zn-dependent protease